MTTAMPARTSRVVFLALHAAIAAASIGLMVGVFPGWWGTSPDATRLAAVGAMIAAYVVRQAITLFVMLQRDVPWGEVWGVSTWILAIDLTMAAGAASTDAAWGVWGWVGVALYAVGSWLNTGSEWGRKRFKQDPAHKGKLYTGGMFAWSQHINYFGDSLAFTGLAIATAAWWSAWIPLVMTAMFIWMHIPRMDAYLAGRYGEDFTRYQARTKSFVPFVW